ncbi:hypothetical protein I6M49_22415 [Shewanella algae]|uniref:hypothetical protein n=1 Tax=Shewanella algae TaxID=38313 RepID=UPI001AAD03D8|nr:hypothetical protein [Shewanella algae]MBO2656201.1 hypothetical protein [Shewanella algae]
MTVRKQVIGAGQLKLSGTYHRSGDIVTLEQDAFDELPDEKQARLQDAPARDGASQPNPCGGDVSAGEQTTGSAKDGHSPLEGFAQKNLQVQQAVTTVKARGKEQVHNGPMMDPYGG